MGFKGPEQTSAFLSTQYQKPSKLTTVIFMTLKMGRNLIILFYIGTMVMYGIQ